MATTALTKRNTLRFTVRPEPATLAPGPQLRGTVDIAEGGRLLGVELDLGQAPALGAPWRCMPSASDTPQFDPATAVFYLPIRLIAPIAGSSTRSASVTVETFAGDDGGLVAIEIPRRGAGYEIAYPSGNQ